MLGLQQLSLSGRTYSLGSSQGHSCDPWDVLQTELANGLSCLLLISAVDSYLRACGDVGIALLLTALVRVGRVRSVLGGGLLGLLMVIRKLLNTGFRHGCGSVGYDWEGARRSYWSMVNLNVMLSMYDC